MIDLKDSQKRIYKFIYIYDDAGIQCDLSHECVNAFAFESYDSENNTLRIFSIGIRL